MLKKRLTNYGITIVLLTSILLPVLLIQYNAYINEHYKLIFTGCLQSLRSHYLNKKSESEIISSIKKVSFNAISSDILAYWITDLEGRLIFHSQSDIDRAYKHQRLTAEYFPLFKNIWTYKNNIVNPSIIDLKSKIIMAGPIMNKESKQPIAITGINMKKGVKPVFRTIFARDEKSNVIVNTILMIIAGLLLLFGIIITILLIFLMIEKSVNYWETLDKKIDELPQDFGTGIEINTEDKSVNKAISNLNNFIIKIRDKKIDTEQKAIVEESKSDERKILNSVKNIYFPSTVSKVPGFDVVLIHKESKGNNRDFYKIFEDKKKQYIITAGSVSGENLVKDIAGISMFGGLLTIFKGMSIKPDDFLISLNNELFKNKEAENSVNSAVCAIINNVNSTLMLSASNFNSIILYKALDNSVLNLRLGGFRPGSKDSSDFKSVLKYELLKLESGDILAFPGEGLIQLEDKDGGQLGLVQINNVIKEHSTESADAIKGYIEKKIESFTSGVEESKEYFILILKKN